MASKVSAPSLRCQMVIVSFAAAVAGSKVFVPMANLFIGATVLERVQTRCCWRRWSRQIVLDHPVDTEPFRR